MIAKRLAGAISLLLSLAYTWGAPYVPSSIAESAIRSSTIGQPSFAMTLIGPTTNDLRQAMATDGGARSAINSNNAFEYWENPEQIRVVVPSPQPIQPPLPTQDVLSAADSAGALQDALLADYMTRDGEVDMGVGRVSSLSQPRVVVDMSRDVSDPVKRLLGMLRKRWEGTRLQSKLRSQILKNTNGLRDYPVVTTWESPYDETSGTYRSNSERLTGSKLGYFNEDTM